MIITLHPDIARIHFLRDAKSIGMLTADLFTGEMGGTHHRIEYKDGRVETLTRRTGPIPDTYRLICDIQIGRIDLT